MGGTPAAGLGLIGAGAVGYPEEPDTEAGPGTRTQRVPE